MLNNTKKENIIKGLELLGLNSNVLVSYLTLLIKLKQRYGNGIFDKKFLGFLKKIDKHFFAVVSILSLFHTRTFKDIKKLVFCIKQKKDFIPSLKITLFEKAKFENVEKYLSKELPNFIINKEKTSRLEIYIDGSENWTYKRSFQKDIEKLLN